VPHRYILLGSNQA